MLGKFNFFFILKCTWNNWKAQTFQKVQKVHTGCIKYFREKNEGTP